MSVDGVFNFKLDEVMEAEVQLLGRVTYDGFAAAWPSREGESPRSSTTTRSTWSRQPHSLSVPSLLAETMKAPSGLTAVYPQTAGALGLADTINPETGKAIADGWLVSYDGTRPAYRDVNGIAYEFDDTGQPLQLDPATIPPAVELLDAVTVADEI